MSKVIVYDVWADWCAPCKKFSPIFDKLAAEYRDFDFVKVDADSNPEFLNDFQIRSIPMILIVRENEVEYSHAGILAEWQMREVLDKI